MAVGEQRPVVVGVDGSPAGLAVADFAVAEAVRRHVTLVIAHVWPGRYARPYCNRGPLPTRDDGRRLLEVAARRAGLAAPGLRVLTELLDGAAGEVLLRASEHAGVMVVGDRGEFAAGPSWGSTSAYLAHHSACPVLVFRGFIPPRGPVVAAVSARPGATATIEYAFAEAARRDSRLVAVHLWSPADPRNASAKAPTGEFVSERHDAERLLAEALAGRSGNYPDVPVERLLIRDVDLAYTVARASRRGCLLVVGRGNHGQFAELLYGSRSGTVGGRSLCPALLVPPGADTVATVFATELLGGHPH